MIPEMYDRNGNSRVWVECPRCHGDWYRDLEPESGLPYSCFRCGNTGQVDAPHGVCRDCGETLLEGEGETLDWRCEACATEDHGSRMARSELAGLLEG